MSARIFCVFSLISAPLLVMGQQPQMAGPVSGYVFDSSAHGLRPVLGMPGASLLGDPVNFGTPVAAVAVAPRQDTAFVTGEDGTFHLFRMRAGTPTEMTLNGVTATPQRVVFSPAGTAAALVGNGSIQVVSGLPDSPAMAAAIDSHAFSGPGSLALSDDGEALLLATGNSVELFGGAADLGPVAQSAGLALVAFAPGGHDAAVVDRGGAGVVLYRGLTGPTQSQPVAPSDDTIQSASALSFSTDGTRLLLANATGGSVTTFDLAGGGRSTVACNCAPSTLARMGDMFRLNEIGSGPVWLLDARPATASLMFIPAAANVPTRQLPTRTGGPRRGDTPVNESVAPAGRGQVTRAE